MRPIQISIVVREGSVYSTIHYTNEFEKIFPDLPKDAKNYFVENKEKHLYLEEGDVCIEISSATLGHDVPVVVQNLYSLEYAIIESKGLRKFGSFRQIIKFILR